MSLTEQLDTVALALAVLAVAMAGAVALSGGVVAQTGTPQPDSGEVELQDPIPEDSAEFDVTVTELDIDGEQGCLDVEKNGEFQTRFDVTEGETITVSAEAVGGLQPDDEILVELLPSTCEGPLDTDRTTVNEAGFFVEVNSTNSPVIEGETYEVEAQISNTGAQVGSQDIVMTVAGGEEDRQTVGLDSQAAVTRTFTWQTTAGDAGDYTVALSSEDDEAITDARVLQQAEFAVTIDSTNSPVAGGETLEVTATVENTDDFEDTQEVVLNIDGNRTGSTNLTLDGGESETVTLEWTTGDGDAGDYTAEVAAGSGSDSAAVTVTTTTPTATEGDGDGGDGDATFEVNITDVRPPDETGGSLEVDATVENTGGQSDTQTVTLTVDGEETDSRELTLDAGESESVTFTAPSAPDDTERQSVRVASEDDADEDAVRLDEGTETDSDDGLLPGNSGGILLLLLLLLLLLAYYYGRRRRYQEDRVPVDGDEGGGGTGGDGSGGTDGAGGDEP